jgi:filamentous hemagglutinin family protein
MKSNSSFLAAAATLLITLPAHAAVLASYEFAGATPAARAAVTTSAANLTAGSFSFASAFSDDVTANRAGFSSASNIFARVTATTASNLTGAITANEYVTVTITPDSGYQLNLTSLTVDLGYSLAAASVPLGVGVNLGATVFSSVDGFTVPSALATQTFTAADTSLETGATLFQNVNIDLTGPAYQGLSGPLEFRIYLYDNENTQTQPIHRIDNFILNGAVVPEPSAALLGGLGMLALLRRRR